MPGDPARTRTAYPGSLEDDMDLGIRGKVAMVAAGSKGLGRRPGPGGGG